MRACFRMGQVVVLPGKGGGRQLQAALLDSGREFIDIIHTTEDVLQHYANTIDEIQLPESARRVEFAAYPVLVRVPAGQELAAASHYQGFPEVAAASPNFHMGPAQGAAVLNPPVVKQAIALLQASPGAPECASGVRVAVLDTGIDPTPLPAGALHALQYDTDRPRDLSVGLAPYDREGDGTGVALVINSVAPGAKLFSVKFMDHVGDLMGLISGMFLAESRFAPHVFNMSLGMDCSVEACEECGRVKETPALVWQVTQISASFRRHAPNGIDPLLVAAGGNDSGRLLIPAGLPQVVAVGAFDQVSSERAEYSRYERIPADRFIMAPGGHSNLTGCVGRSLTGSFQPRPLFGTSFSSAFVSGLAARYMCDRMCGVGCVGSDLAWQCLVQSADRTFPNYSLNCHGQGVARYDMSVGTTVRRTRMGVLPAASPFPLPPEALSLEELKQRVRERAYSIWEQEGQPPQAADVNWQRARRELGVPESLTV